MLTWEFEKNKDKPAYAGLMAPGFLAITDRGPMNTAQNLQEIDDMVVEDYSTSDFNVIFLEKDVALLTYKAKWNGLYKGKPFNERNYSAAIWARHGNTWLDEFYQETIVPPPSSVLLGKSVQGRSQAANGEAAELSVPNPKDITVDELVGMEKKTWELAKRKDKSSYDDLLGAEFIAVSDNGLMDKAHNVAELDNLRIDSYSIPGFQVKLIRNDIGLITYRVKSKGTYKGKAFDSDNYAASLWVRRGAKWLNVFLQETGA